MASKLKKIALLGLLIVFTANSAYIVRGFGTKTSSFEDDSINTPLPSATEDVGAWIIIAGDRSDHDKLGHIIYGCDRVYEILTGCGYGEDDIEYLIPEVDGYSSPYNDGYTTLANIDTAITSWAAPKVNENKSLGMYLFDHGGVNSMCIPGTDLSASHLDSQLDALTEETGCARQIVIYEACHSGSFIDELSQTNRIIAAATDITHGSSVNPAGNWATFSEGFWNSIAKCNSIGEAFEDAEAFVEASGLGGGQIPWLDDNHDGVGNEVDFFGNLPNGGDGSDALNTYVCSKIECYIKFWVLIPIWRWYPIEIPEFIYPIKLDTDRQGVTYFIRVIPPGFVVPELDRNEEGHSLLDPQLPLIAVEDDGEHGDGLEVDLTQFIGEEGLQICVYAQDEKGMLSNVISSFATFNQDGESPEDKMLPAVQIVSPKFEETIRGMTKVKVEAKDDYGIDKVQLFLDDVLLKEQEMGDFIPYPEIKFELNSSLYDDGQHNLKAIAFDLAGNTEEDFITVEFENMSDNGGGFPFPDIPGFTPLFLVGVSVLAVLYILSKKIRRS